MGEEKISKSSVSGKTTSKEAKGVFAHLVVAHVDLLDVSIVVEGFRDWLDLAVR